MALADALPARAEVLPAHEGTGAATRERGGPLVHGGTSAQAACEGA
uniref:Uncharacterized protein n=1 Tax=Nonomuraea gerenzanensis TaxID=93944 RepID=A0A1M4EPU5_9ACTN|nr:hypothetical protein BN4615_P10397 [Nonomuraea gerenzanensis]